MIVAMYKIIDIYQVMIKRGKILDNIVPSDLVAQLRKRLPNNINKENVLTDREWIEIAQLSDHKNLPATSSSSAFANIFQTLMRIRSLLIEMKTNIDERTKIYTYIYHLDILFSISIQAINTH